KLLVFIGCLAPMGNTIETIRELDAASHQKSSAGFFPSPRPITPLPSYQRGTFCRQFRPAKSLSAWCARASQLSNLSPYRSSSEAPEDAERVKRTRACSQENRTGGHEPKHRQRLDGCRGSNLRGNHAHWPHGTDQSDPTLSPLQVR